MAIKLGIGWGPLEDTPADEIPNLDQEEPRATYRDWLPEATKIVVCCIGNHSYPGERFNTRDDARREVRRRYGRILEANYVKGRAFFRVTK